MGPNEKVKGPRARGKRKKGFGRVVWSRQLEAFGICYPASLQFVVPCENLNRKQPKWRETEQLEISVRFQSKWQITWIPLYTLEHKINDLNRTINSAIDISNNE